MKDLFARFEDYFEIVPVRSRQELEDCQHFRYQVFCEENHILKAGRCRLERDDYDHRSAHSMLRYRPTGEIAALVRLVLPDRLHRGYHFPLEEHLETLKPAERHIFEALPRNRSAEISRFSVSKHFRRRPGEDHTNHGIGPSYGKQRALSARRMDSFITLGLFKAIVHMSAEHHITHWLAFMEPALIRLLGRVGIRFQAVGPLIDHCGQRHACVSHAHKVLVGIRETRPDVWDFITTRGEKQLTEEDADQHASSGG